MREASGRSFYRAQTGLICLENTHNIRGGVVSPQEVGEEICDQAHAAGLPVHLDGARIFNAASPRARASAN